MIALAVLPMIATIGLALQLAMLAPSLKALAALGDVAQFAPLDMGPPVTILVLSLVFAGVLVLAACACPAPARRFGTPPTPPRVPPPATSRPPSSRRSRSTSAWC
ncbi:hypothetical protein BH10PSE3_BH10PSE3_11880 [soil metagenome]